jgi:hypothetical protein
MNPYRAEHDRAAFTSRKNEPPVLQCPLSIGTFKPRSSATSIARS